MVLLQGQCQVERLEGFPELPVRQQQPPAFNLVVNPVRAVGVLVLDCPAKLSESQRRFIALQVKPGSQPIQMSQGGLERDSVVQLLKRQVQTFQAPERKCKIYVG